MSRPRAPSTFGSDRSARYAVAPPASFRFERSKAAQPSHSSMCAPLTDAHPKSGPSGHEVRPGASSLLLHCSRDTDPQGLGLVDLSMDTTTPRPALPPRLELGVAQTIPTNRYLGYVTAPMVFAVPTSPTTGPPAAAEAFATGGAAASVVAVTARRLSFRFPRPDGRGGSRARFLPAPVLRKRTLSRARARALPARFTNLRIAERFRCGHGRVPGRSASAPPCRCAASRR